MPNVSDVCSVRGTSLSAMPLLILCVCVPSVAVFDAVSIADRTDPLILAQPTPALSDLYPSRLRELRKLSKQDKVVYVGRVGDSLYALSNDTFPFVIFSPLLGLPPTYPEHGETQQQVCTTLDCLTGPHRID